MLARREDLSRRHLAGRLALRRLLPAAGRHADAADTYRRAISHDDYLEAAHRGLMQAVARQFEPG